MPITYTYTITRSDNGQPIADADVWVTTDAAGSNTIQSGKTDQYGVVTFSLDAGTVYIWRQKSGTDFTNPDAKTVSALIVAGSGTGTPSSSGTQLCTRQQVKDAIRITGASDDTRIDGLIADLTQIVMETYCREFVPHTTATRTFRVKSRLVDLSPYDLRTVTTMKLHPEEASPTTLTANSDYVLMPTGGDRTTGTYTYLRLAEDLSIDSDLVTKFGFAQLEIAGAWGIWAGAGTVSKAVNRAAVQTVLANLDRPAAQVAAVEEISEGGPPRGPGWAIPFAAHRVFWLYTRNLGVA